MKQNKIAAFLLIAASVAFLITLISYVAIFISSAFELQAQLGFGSASFNSLVFTEASFAVLSIFGIVIILVAGVHAYYSNTPRNRQGYLLLAVDSVLTAILLLGIITFFCTPPEFITGPRFSGIVLNSCGQSHVSFALLPLLIGILGSVAGLTLNQSAAKSKKAAKKRSGR